MTVVAKATAANSAGTAGEGDRVWQVMQLTFFKIFDFASDARLWQLLTKHSISLRLRIFALRKIVEKEIERSNATVPGDDKIGSRVSWWFAGSARYPSNPSGIT